MTATATIMDGHQLENVMKVFMNSHWDSDETPCKGPYQMNGWNGENYGIAYGDSADDVVADAQNRNLEVHFAVALHPDSLRA